MHKKAWVFKIVRMLGWFVLVFGILLFVFLAWLFVGKPQPLSQGQTWGVDFSADAARGLDQEPMQVLIALLDDLKVRNFRIAAHWNQVEPTPNGFDFEELESYLSVMQSRGATAIVSMGLKTPRWPECHIPDWAKDLPKEKQQERILDYEKQVVLRLKENPAVEMWQVENEPFVYFGTCPWRDADFLRKEIEMVRSLDPSRKIMTTDSGEWSFWLRVAASPADIIGATMYRNVFFGPLNRYITYPFRPISYARKASLVALFTGKKVWNSELQLEPWAPRALKDTPDSEADFTMNIEKFRDMVSFAKAVPNERVYAWGAEWWYWRKNAKGDDRFWEEARALFR